MRAARAEFLVAVEDDDRELALGQALLLLEVRQRYCKLRSLLGLSGTGTDREGFGFELDSGDWVREKVVIPGRRPRCAVVRGDHDQSLAIATVTKHHRSFLSAPRAGRREKEHWGVTERVEVASALAKLDDVAFVERQRGVRTRAKSRVEERGRDRESFFGGVE